MSFVYPGPTNTYLISHEATNNLIVTFSRNPKEFALSEYIQIVPVTKMTGAWLKITADEAARITDTDLSQFIWADGQESPMHDEGLESHDWQAYITKRYAFGFNLGDLTVQQASWNILEAHQRIKAQQAMTARTQAAHTVLSTAGNWDTSTTASATAQGGGKWDVSGVSDLFIKRALGVCADTIIKNTLGQVKPKDLVVVLNPVSARKMANTGEIHSYIKESPAALAQLRGDVPSQNGKFGLPDVLYGYRLVIEDCVKRTNVKGATQATSYVMSSTEAYMLARVGGIEGIAGSPSFSTISTFMMEEMTVETKRDDDNRRVKARIVENYQTVMTAPVAGFQITAITS